MADSLVQQIVTALKVLAADVLIANGYNTDAGAHVYSYEPGPSVATLPYIAILPGSQQLSDMAIGGATGPAAWDLDVTIEAVADADVTDRGLTCEWLRADLHAAFLGADDGTLGGVVEAMSVQSIEASARGDGSNLAGASLSLRIRYAGTFGDPYL